MRARSRRQPGLDALLCALMTGFVMLSALSMVPAAPAEGADGSFGGGSGTPADPYIVEDVRDLQNMSADLDAHYALGADIDASATKGWPAGAGFAPLGDSGEAFTGSLDGRNRTITGLYIDRPSDSNVGLFGCIEGQGSVRDVALVNVDVTGRMDVGGLVGFIDGGTVAGCHVTGNVVGSSAGGLVGYNEGTIDDSHFSGNVKGTYGVGGLAEHVGPRGIVSDSYFTGRVTGPTEAGGLVASSALRGKLVNSHYNIDEVLINGGHRVTIGGLFDAQYGDWNSSGPSLSISDYSGVLVPSGEWFDIGSVQGLRDLLGFAGVEGYRFRLSADIDLSGAPGLFVPYLAAEFDGANHTISGLYIDSPTTDCVGMFGYSARSTIGNIRIVDAVVNGGDCAGCLLGYNYHGTVHDSNVSGDVDGGTDVGVLVGCSYRGWISRCRSEGHATSDESYVGGLAGENEYGVVSDSHSKASARCDRVVGGLLGGNIGTVSNSSATGGASGTFEIGGLVGNHRGGLISGSFSAGDVSGYQSIGGLIGMGSGDVGDSYASGNVTGTKDVGGLMGNCSGCVLSKCYSRGAVAGSVVSGLVGTAPFSISGCFWDTQTSGQTMSHGGTGRTTAEMMTCSTFANAGWDFSSVWCMLEHATYPLLRWQDTEPPVAEAGDDQTVEAGTLVELNGTRSTDDLGISQCTWTLDDGGPVTLHGDRAEHQFNRTGTFVVTLNVTDIASKWDTDAVNVTVVDTTDPVAEAGPDQAVDEGTIVAFDGSASSDRSDIVDYVWTLTDVSLVTLHGARQTHLFDKPGVRVVTLRVTDAAGNWDTDTMTVTVRDVTPPVADAGPDRTVDQRADVAFDGSASSDNVGVTSYTWTFMDGASVTLHGVDPTYRFATHGTFVVTLNVTDAAGHWDTDTVTITVSDVTPPVACAGADLTVDEDCQMTFDGSGCSDDVGIADYTWSFTDGVLVVLHGVGPSYLFSDPGVFLVTLSVTDAAGNSGSDAMTVVVRDVTPPTADAGPDQTIDEWAIAAFDGSGSSDNVGIAEFTWTFVYRTGGTTLHGVAPSFMFDVPGTYTVLLNVTDAAGHWGEDAMTLTVRDATPPVAVAGPDRAVPAGSTVTLDGSGSLDNVGVVNWTWTLTYDGLPRTLPGEAVPFTFEVGGVYEVVLTVSDTSGNLDDDVAVITVVDTGRVTGTVLDERGRPVEGARVELTASNGTTRSTTTVANGSFAMDVHHGNFTWRVAKDGYGTITGTSSVDPMGTTVLDLPALPLEKEEERGLSTQLLLIALVVIATVVAAAAYFLRKGRH